MYIFIRPLIVWIICSLSSAVWAGVAVQAIEPPEEILLWPKPPTGEILRSVVEQQSKHGAVSHVAVPRLIVYRPTHPTGTAVLVISGGGYKRIELAKESTPTSQWLQSQGITAFELIYRMPSDWPVTAPFQDAQRAMRLIRANAARYHLQSNRIGILGFSAGGHLAGMTAVTTAALYPPVDAADHVSARPDFAALIYPVITVMPPFDHTSTRRQLVGDHPTLAQSQDYSINLHIQDDTPPTFLAQAMDDPISPVDNSMLMQASLRTHQVASEVHLFQTGGHGWGLGRVDSPTAAWPALFLTWLRQNGDLVGDEAVVVGSP